ncbi:hypothetical protein [Maribellus maritimus]|uniref:hypothetical protein n=1 Tax=Maribellus maritimus TaxID=2870838 RepID=UPI001EEB88BA|nr:hypothetical protein [Maribellus maritimus]MCG6189271.1 hypothetical protein [Maribellus maritimus]
MKKLLIFTLLVAFAATLNAATQTRKKDILGKWKYEVASAPYGYEKGTLVFSEKEGELAGEVQFIDGSKAQMTKISFEDETLKCGLYVEGGYIGIEAKIDGKNMAGSVDTPDGKIDLKAEKTE